MYPHETMNSKYNVHQITPVSQCILKSNINILLTENIKDIGLKFKPSNSTVVKCYRNQRARTTKATSVGNYIQFYFKLYTQVTYSNYTSNTDILLLAHYTSVDQRTDYTT